MGRTIINQTKAMAAESDDSAQAPDNYASQIVKLIPIEIVGVYLGISNLIKGVYSVQWIIFFLVLFITPFYLKRVASVTDKAQVAVATISYIIWAFSLGGPFEHLLKDRLPTGFTVASMGGVLIMLYTLIVPLIYSGAKKS